MLKMFSRISKHYGNLILSKPQNKIRKMEVL